MEKSESDSSTIQLTFSFQAGVREGIDERFSFWNLPSTIKWFAKRGYILYDCIEEGLGKPALPCEVDCEAQYPFAYCDGEIYKSEAPEKFEVSLLASEDTGKLVFAQDSSTRQHVVIKVLHANSHEYRVVKFLSEQPLKTLEEACILPVLELLANGDYWFAVMPRWGGSVHAPKFTRFYEAIDLAHCMLKGLAFLHKHNIVHGDIGSLNNVVVNHFSNQWTIKFSTKRKELRLNRRLSYALIDYDCSYMLPSRDSRLPYRLSWGTWNMTGDTDAGEFDYDPFALDVGGVGVTLRDRYQNLTGLFPALALLFDMMTTWDARRRFTASQALDFFEAHLHEITEDQLAADISTHEPVYILDYDRWQHLSPNDVERWKMYRDTPEPWTRKLLRKISTRKYWCYIVPWIRWRSFQLFFVLPRRCYNWFFASRIHLV